MKILFVCSRNSVFNPNSNPFVLSLMEGLHQCGHQVDCGLELFWDNFFNYDVIYFQWPEEIFKRDRTLVDLEKLQKQFEVMRNKGIKTVVTCHNLHPHNNDPLFTDLYEMVYTNVDSFHHMGNYSFQLMKEKFPNKYHFLVPHHVADSLFEQTHDIKEAKRKLNIPEKNIVVASFGAFRNDEEVKMFLMMAKNVGRKHVVYLAPRLPSIGRLYNGRLLVKTIAYIYKYVKYKYLNVRRAGLLSKEELDLWLSATDIVFIQRFEILNSGNVPLAFSKGKVVVGPDIGNVGEILRDTGNYIFLPHNYDSIKLAVKNAIHDIRTGSKLGKKNYDYAIKNWNESHICSSISLYLDRLVNQLL